MFIVVYLLFEKAFKEQTWFVKLFNDQEFLQSHLWSKQKKTFRKYKTFWLRWLFFHWSLSIIAFICFSNWKLKIYPSVKPMSFYGSNTMNIKQGNLNTMILYKGKSMKFSFSIYIFSSESCKNWFDFKMKEKTIWKVLKCRNIKH